MRNAVLMWFKVPIREAVKGEETMLKKGANDLLAEANAQIETIDVQAGLSAHGQPDVVFVDVREQSERANGFIAGSVHAPRGFLEFAADPQTPMHVADLSSGKRLVLYCGSGGRSALAARTLAEMGLENVCHMAGGFAGWVQNGGPTEG